MRYMVHAKVLCSQMYSVDAVSLEEAASKVKQGLGSAQSEPEFEDYIGSDDWWVEGED